MTNSNSRLLILFASLIFLFTLSTTQIANATPGEGYYRYPAIHDNTIVFTSEGDLWKISTNGGVASRLTTHADAETHSQISPDGKLIAFTARYEGPTEVYVMPIDGGLPKRITYTGERCYVVGWTPSGELMYSTIQYSTLPQYQIIVHNLNNSNETILPLAKARHGSYDDKSNLFFNMRPHQGSWAKRYKGGTAQNIWKYTGGENEAINLTEDYTGTNKIPIWYDARVYFLSDRDGTMNVWSMAGDGTDKKQITTHAGWDIQNFAISNSKIVYHVGADLYLFDLTSNTSSKLEITLASDFDQRREKWVEKPMDYLTSFDLSSDGSKIALTARGQVFVAPVEEGRFLRVTRKDDVRYRKAVFMPDGKSVLALSDETGELEFWRMPANGVGKQAQLTDNGDVLRWFGVPSPDGKLIAYNDKDLRLWIFNTESGDHTLVGESEIYDYEEFLFSPDNKWLVYVKYADNYFRQIYIYNIDKKNSQVVTSDRFHSFSPVWSPDGKWLYFISDRNYSTIYGGVWGTRQDEPFFDKRTELFMLPLKETKRSPFLLDDEVSSEAINAEQKDEKNKKDNDKEEDSDKTVKVEIDFNGIEKRLIRVPVPAGEYSSLTANKKFLFWRSRPRTGERKSELQAVEIGDSDAEVTTIVSSPRAYQLSANGKKLIVRKKNSFYVFDAKAKKITDLSDHKVDLSGWSFNLNPVLEWKQMFTEAWRLHRDYFYDANLHGLDWPAILQKYIGLVERISDRDELSNLLGQMVSELETLHTSVYGGDFRDGNDDVGIAALGARMVRDVKTGGYKIDHIYANDPDYPDKLSPLARADLDIENGDIILSINGIDLSTVASIGLPLRDKAGEQILLHISDRSTGKERDVVIKPLSSRGERNLRYNEWEYTRRLQVEKESNNQIGYVHLRHTGTSEFGKWARDFYPVFKRQGLIIDNRHNGGGNIDPWMVSRLMRKAWAYWEPRKGIPESNQQYAFSGHIVVLCNEHTGSDGELFTEGLRRMVDAKVIGVRTWGGEVWLTSSNRLVDKGIATAAEFAVYGVDGEWLIEGHGVVPDIVVENYPKATFDGKDAQLEAAIEYLKGMIKEKPFVVPKAPPYPAKAKK